VLTAQVRCPVSGVMPVEFFSNWCLLSVLELVGTGVVGGKVILKRQVELPVLGLWQGMKKTKTCC